MARPSSRPPAPLGLRLNRWMDEQKAADPWGRGPSQSDIAAALGVSSSTVSEWKYGDSVPTIENLRALAVFTRIPFAELVDDIELTAARRAESAGKKRAVGDDARDTESQDPGGMNPA